MFTQESLAGKSNAELCAIVTELGGVAPKSGKFRTKAEGIAKVLELASMVPVSVETAPEPTTKLERLESKLASATDAAEIRILRKKVRRITKRAARARRAAQVQAARVENSKRNRQRAEKLKRAQAA